MSSPRSYYVLHQAFVEYRLARVMADWLNQGDHIGRVTDRRKLSLGSASLNMSIPAPQYLLT